MSIKKIKRSWCVIHSHSKKRGSKTDKPKGTIIKCYSIVKYGEQGAYNKALMMHRAIIVSKDRRKK